MYLQQAIGRSDPNAGSDQVQPRPPRVGWDQSGGILENPLKSLNEQFYAGEQNSILSGNYESMCDERHRRM